jgi:hypothetical protein
METDSGGPVMPFLFIVITIAVLWALGWSRRRRLDSISLSAEV